MKPLRSDTFLDMFPRPFSGLLSLDTRYKKQNEKLLTNVRFSRLVERQKLDKRLLMMDLSIQKKVFHVATSPYFRGEIFVRIHWFDASQEPAQFVIVNEVKSELAT